MLWHAQVFVPGHVGGGPSHNVVDDVEDEEGYEKNGTDSCPHDLPVPVGTMTDHVFYVFLKSFDSIDVADSYDFNEDNEEKGEGCSIVVEHGEPVIPWCGGEAQTEQHTEQTHHTIQ